MTIVVLVIVSTGFEKRRLGARRHSARRTCERNAEQRWTS